MKPHHLLPLGLLVLSCTPSESLSRGPHEGGPRAGAIRGGEGSVPTTRDGLHFAAETYTLPNGMTVTLLEDHSLPKAVINTWFSVGSKDEEPGRTGFAHLFEHLMFMGTGRVPDNQFDILMERGGGSNNASTSQDRTNYYSQGPSALLPTLLWLDADRLDALAEFMTQEKLDRQRDVVRNERRQTSENVPYGKSELLLPEALYPAGHPYHHPVIGSHEDLEAATLQDVIDFFQEFYVPANASLVIAGDFDAAEVRTIVEHTFGAIPAKPSPAHRSAPPVVMTEEKRLIATDRVEFPKLYLVWHSPAYFAPGDAELDLVAAILAGGPSSRLEKRLVLDTRLAQEVDASQSSDELGSTFEIDVLAAPGVDLEAIKHEVLDVLDELVRDGPTPEELARAQARHESSFLRRMEGLLARADRMNAYRHYLGIADGFQRDLDRYAQADVEDLRRWASQVFGPGRVDLRILPEGASAPEAALDRRPEDFAPSPFAPPAPESFTLSNGVTVHALARPGTRLFAGTLLVSGGESRVPVAEAGLADLCASMLESGAGGLDAAAFSDAVESLGASVRCSAGREEMLVGVDGLTSRMDETLDRFADVIQRPNLTAQDFERERTLALAAIQARKDDPRQVARNLARILLFGAEDPRGRPLEGSTSSVERLTRADVQRAHAELLDPARATFVFVGDFRVEDLRHELEERFGSWRPRTRREAVEASAPLVEPVSGRIVLVDRPGAPQTVIQALRPVSPADGVERAARDCVDTVFGGTFTSRLNANLREDKGYTYGAGSRIVQDGDQFLMLVSTSVRTDATGAALTELKKEFDAMARSGVSADELSKAVETLRRRLVETAETTGRMEATLVNLVANGRPLDALASDLRALDEVELDAANRLASSGLYEWNDLVVVLVGDREEVRRQLAEAGLPEPEDATAP